jgi:hypothetical protein
VASLIGPELGWDEERCRLEAETYSSGIQEQLAKAGLDPIGTGPRGGRVASESP